MGTVGQPGWVRPKMPAYPKGMQVMLVPRDACQNGHVVIAVGRIVILVCTDFMGTTVVRGCVVV